MKNNNHLKTSIICEGEMDKEFVNFLKNSLYKDRKPVCKEHSRVISGTIKLENIIAKKDFCCKTFYFFDKDELKEKVIQNLKNKIMSQGDVSIYSIPQMEVCFLAIFEKHNDLWIDKKKLEDKLLSHIKKNIISNYKYKHDLNSVKIISKYLKELIENKNKKYNLEQFEENLEHYYSNKWLYTNIIEYIKHLKKEN